jgi:hypothetical protein
MTRRFVNKDENSEQFQEVVEETYTKKGIKFLSSERDNPRTDKEWPKYFEVERGEGNDRRMIHRVTDTPIDRIKGINPISSFPIEEMHLVDGGAFKNTIETLLKITDPSKITNKRKKVKVVSSKKKNKTVKKKLPVNKRQVIVAKDLAAWNCRIAVWSRFCRPKEFRRSVRTLKAFKIYKMCEVRQLMLYYMIALMTLDKTFPKREMNFVVKLIKGYLLVTGNSYEPVPEADLKAAEKLLKEFFIGIRSVSKSSCTYRMHGAWKHLVEDARHFRCRTTSLSAYPFENQVGFFRKVR